MNFYYLTLTLLSASVIVSADLRSDLRDFIELVPRGRVAFLAGRHFLFDASFRAGFNYLRSSKFETLVRDEFSTNVEVQSVTEYLGSDIDFVEISRLIKRVVIRLRPAEEYGRIRTLTSFVREVADILPDEKIAKLIRDKKANSPEFANLYGKIVHPQFKTLVYQARNSNSLVEAFKMLRNNQVNVDEFLQIAFQLLGKWDKLA